MQQQAAKPALTSRKTIGIGVVGIGFGQQVLVPAFRGNSACVVKALCASSTERAASTAGKLGVEKAYGDWSELLRDPDIDAVAIATPASIQAEIALQAVRNGKHIFLEKPVAVNAREAGELLSAAQQAGVAHTVDFEFPELDRWLKAREIIQQGGLGKIRHASISWNVETYVNKAGLVSWKSDSQSGGGALNNLVSHIFHYVEWFLGPVKKLSCTLSAAPGDARPADSIVNLALVLESDVSVSVSVCCCAFMGSGHRMEFFGDDGTLVLSNSTADHARGFKLFYATRSAGSLDELPFDNPEEAPAADGRIVPVSKLVDRFVSWIREGIISPPSLLEGYRVQCLIEAARQSNLTGRWMDQFSF